MVGRLSCEEWFVIIGFVTSQESICMWLLTRKTRAAMELFGARLVRTSGWVHSGVFDDEQKRGRGSSMNGRPRPTMSAETALR